MSSVFQTHAWQGSWWETYGDTEGFTLTQEWDGKTSGLYEARYTLKGLPVRSIQFVGTAHRTISTPRTEYNCFTGPEESPESVFRAVSNALKSKSWTEAALCDVKVESPDYRALQKLAAQEGWVWRSLSSDCSYSVDTRGEFSHYLASLGSNSRLKLFNRRKILESLGRITVVDAESAERDRFLEKLDEFHRARWGRPCFGGEKGMKFQKAFLERLPDERGKPLLSVMSWEGEPISVLYNVLHNGRIYNIQGGFKPDFHKKLALGTLHLGYCIEQAFTDEQVQCFDMLAGTGKNENYKSRIANQHEQVESVMLVRSLPFKLLYRVKG